MSKIDLITKQTKITIALYLRISNEDTTGSITNQRALLREFVKKTPDLANCKTIEIIDDGHTGTNFARPGAQQLIEMAKAGLVQCIIVKDLSRFGRNYIEVGDFLEQKFPAWSVRFISIGDNYDSARQSNPLDSAFRNLIYQIYSQDLSVKCRTGKDSATKRGKIITTYPTFGYSKDENDRHKFVLDPIDAPIVKRVFDLAEQGNSIPAIAKILNADGTPTKQKSKHRKGFTKNWGISNSNNHWTNAAVRSILQNECYTGKWIYGKTRTTRVGARTIKKVPRCEWLIVPNALPAIVTEEQFAAVQAKIKTTAKKRPAHKPPIIPLPTENTEKHINPQKHMATKMALWERYHNKTISQEEFIKESASLQA